MNPAQIEEIVASLTDAQKRVVERVVDSASTHSGRNGTNVQVMRALARKGLVRQGKVHTHETDWHFTEVGTAVGQHLHRQRLDEGCRSRATPELKAWLDSTTISAMRRESIVKELGIRGWQQTADNWTCADTPEWRVVEGIAGIYSYHVRDASQPKAETLPAACGAQVMTTSIPLGTWGMKSHIPSRWCATCAARADLPGRKDA